MLKISQIDEIPCQAEVRILQKITLKGLASAGKGLSKTGFSQSLTHGNALLMSPIKGETAVDGC